MSEPLFDPSLKKKKAKKQLDLSELDALDAPAAPVESEKAAAAVAEPPSATQAAETIEKVADEPEDLGFGDLKKKKKKKALPLDFELVSAAWRGNGAQQRERRNRRTWGIRSGCMGIALERAALESAGVVCIPGSRAGGLGDVESGVGRHARAAGGQSLGGTHPSSASEQLLIHLLPPGWYAFSAGSRDGRRRPARAGLGRRRRQGRGRGGGR